MKKIGLINLNWANNHGAILLAYALQEYILKNSFADQVEIIDYRSGGGNWISENEKIGLERNLFKFKLYNYLSRKKRTKQLKQPYFGRPYREHIEERSKGFEEFRNKYLIRSRQLNKVPEQLNEYSHIIVGSDVVWKPEIVACKHFDFYLGKCFGSETIGIAYAASIGIENTDILNYYKNKYRDGIQNFKYISVRENSARQYLQKLTDLPVKQCIDPVFLLDKEDYSCFITNKTRKAGRFVYLFILGNNQKAVDLAKHLAFQKKLLLKYMRLKGI